MTIGCVVVVALLVLWLPGGQSTFGVRAQVDGDPLTSAGESAGARPASASPADAQATSPGPLQAVALPTALPETYGLVDTWLPETPTGMKLFHPMGIAVDDRGTVVIAEAGNGRLTRASPRGTEPNSLDPLRPPDRIGRAGSAPGEFLAPEDVAVSSRGERIYVADTGNGRVQVLAPDGTVLGLWPDVGLPRGIAVGPGRDQDDSPVADSRVYVADADGARVRVYEPDGTWLADWSLGGEHSVPLGLSVTASGDLVVADRSQQRIVWLDADGSDGPLGAVVGTLELDNAHGPGGAPSDVAVDESDEVYVAVERAVLRFRPAASPGPEPRPGTGVADRLAFSDTWPMLRNELPEACLERGCATPGCQAIVTAERDVHEGVQRLHLLPGGGLYITFAPGLRWPDRVVVYPALPGGGISPPHYEEGWVWPLLCRDYSEAEYRHASDMVRVDSAPEPLYSVGLDSAEYLRVRQGNGEWFGGRRAMQAVPGLDLAVNRSDLITAILDGNFFDFLDPMCLVQGYAPAVCLAPPIRVLDTRQLIRRDRTNECRRAQPIPWRSAEDGPCIPEDRWWHTAVGFSGEIVTALDTGQRQLIARITRGPRRGELAAQVRLGALRDPFRAFVDVDYDRRGRLWVLAQDGTVRLFDERGRDEGEMTLVGAASNRASSLSVAPDGTFFVLTGDERIVKYAPEVLPPATPTATLSPTPGPSPRPTRSPPRPTSTPRPTLPSRAVPLAEWGVEDLAGPGRYRDLAVGDDGRVVVPDADHDRMLVFGPLAATPTPSEPPPPGLGPCRFDPVKRASPTRMPLGDTTEVTLQVTGTCGSRHEAVDVVAVIDISCQMAGERFARAREGMVALVDALTLPQDRLSFVTFMEDQGGARVVVPLTTDRDRLREAAQTLTTDCRIMDECRELDFLGLGYMRSYLYPYGCRTEGRISDGLRAGREVLLGPDARPDAGQVLILLSSSLHDSRHVLATLSRDPETFEPPLSPAEMSRWNGVLPEGAFAEVTDREHARWEAWRLRDAGVRVLTTGVGVDSYGAGHPPDEGLLAFVAWPADGYRPAGTPDELVGVLADEGREISARLLMATAVLTDRIPANMRLVPGSVRPPAEVLPDGGRPNAILRWTFADVPFAGLPELSYRLQPLETGLWPTNTDAIADYIDGLGYEGRVVFPVPRVDVIGPTPTDEPTPTDGPTTVPASPTPSPSVTPSATVTPSPSASATTPPTAVASPTATAAPRPIYLPYMQRRLCKMIRRPVDVALAIDTSSSMTGDKLAGAQRAVGAFVGLLDLRPTRDRAAVVGFDNAARVAQPLTNDRAALAAALAGLSITPGTRIDLGLQASVDELLGVRRREDADRALILLTDGRPMPGTEDAAVATGALARASGVATWAIGLGADVDPGILVEIAGSPDQVVIAPNPDELESIYRRIASGIICR